MRALSQSLIAAPAVPTRGYTAAEVVAAGPIQVARQMLSSPGTDAWELLPAEETATTVEPALAQPAAGPDTVGTDIPMQIEPAVDNPPTAEAEELVKLRQLLQERDAELVQLRAATAAAAAAAAATAAAAAAAQAATAAMAEPDDAAMEVEEPPTALQELEVVKDELAAVRLRQDRGQKEMVELLELQAAQRQGGVSPARQRQPVPGAGAFERGGCHIQACSGAAAEADRLHRGLHASEVWLDSIPDDVHAAIKVCAQRAAASNFSQPSHSHIMQAPPGWIITAPWPLQ